MSPRRTRHPEREESRARRTALLIGAFVASALVVLLCSYAVRSAIDAGERADGASTVVVTRSGSPALL